MPEELTLILSRKFDSSAQVWEMEDLLKEFKREIKARERCGLVVTEKKEVRPKKYDNYTTAQPLIVHGKRPNLKVTCLFCKQNHQCTVVTEISARKAIVKKDRRCYICLRQNHLARECRSTWICFQCKKRHHQSICDQDDIGMRIQRMILRWCNDVCKSHGTSFIVNSKSRSESLEKHKVRSELSYFILYRKP